MSDLSHEKKMHLRNHVLEITMLALKDVTKELTSEDWFDVGANVMCSIVMNIAYSLAQKNKQEALQIVDYYVEFIKSQILKVDELETKDMNKIPIH